MKSYSLPFLKLFFPALMVLAICLLPVALSAQTTNPHISIQGTLKTAAGASVADGTYNVTFILYDAATNGTAVWQETKAVDVIGGIYSHLLGSATPLEPADFATTLFLAVRVNTYEMVPRTELSYAPYAFSVAVAQTVLCSGAVGDVKYSVLNPTQFAAKNGDCWVPMDGRSIAGSELATTTGWTNVPDAGGYFLRAQEFPTSPDVDPGRTTTTAIAQAQSDELKSHNHTHNFTIETAGNHTHGYLDRWINDAANDGPYANNNGTPYWDTPRTTDPAGNHTHNLLGGIQPTNGAETRPKNLNVWVYIRIN